MTTPLFETLAGARGAAQSVWKIIKRKSEIDPLDPKGLQLDKLKGDIEFENVKFNYPSRPDDPVSFLF